MIAVDKIENDVPKYRKKKQSNVSRAKDKSDHKHQYKECLITYEGSPHFANYCTVCGKLKDVNFFEFGNHANGFYRILDDSEAFQKYIELKQFKVDSLSQQYVDI